MPSVNPEWVAWAEMARNWAAAFTLAAALAAGLFGLFRYLRSERLRQTEQVRGLYTMFFENDRYRRIRFVLSDPSAPEFAELVAELGAPGLPGPMEGELIDLLNFLEFVTGLARRGLVARKDVDWMFRNFIDQIARLEPIRAYVMGKEYAELQAICRRGLKARGA
jgi:hypothetical protein